MTKVSSCSLVSKVQRIDNHASTLALLSFCNHLFKVIGKRIIKGFILICWFSLNLLRLFP